MRIPLLTFFLDFLHGNRLIIFNSREIVRTLSVRIGERTPRQYDNLQKSRQYIASKFIEYGTKPIEETYHHEGKEYANILVEIPGKRRGCDEVLIVGAHYDTVEGSCGANDNATGIAALLEIYRILSRHRYKRTIRFVAFTLEEPPHFNSESMGSIIHSTRCAKRKDRISMMISLDMLGFAGLFVKQEYPSEDMRNRYPATGDFLAVASLPSHAQYAFTFKKIFNKHGGGSARIHDFVAPASVQGINSSDHMSFHKFGIPSILVSDTGHYRNKNYHTENDTENTVNYWFLSANILQLSQTIRDLANRKKIP
ncbi:MAG TPA: M28 family peptidase [Spirochaetota bacterium]